MFGRLCKCLRSPSIQSWEVHACSQSAYLSTVKPTTVQTAKKMAPNAFIQYSSEKFEQFKLDNPGYPASQYTKDIAEDWNALSLEERKVYQERSQKVQQQLDKEYEALTEAEKAQRIEMRQMKLNKRYMQAIRKEKKDSGRPVRYKTSWNYFVQEHIGGKMNSTSMSQLKADFDALSPKDKLKYEAMKEADKIRYALEMKIWIDKIKKDGNDHLLSYQMIKKYS